MQFSRFGEKFNRYAGITQLMDDLNEGLRTEGAIMLGGGNPAAIPQILDYFHELGSGLLNNGGFIDAIANYDGPQGKSAFLRSLTQMLRDAYGWPVTERNISLTNGSQSAFFALFNLLAGEQADGSFKKILLPLAPEYIGYSGAGLDEDIFVSCRPEIELLENGLFKYHVDFDHLPLDDNIAAICVSRPTNPTGNVLTDEEVARLDTIARERGIPLIIDNAYGTPFPNIIFESVTPCWNDNTIVCMSLSKLGLPGLRCGIVIANETVTQAMTNINSIISLAPGSLGPALAHQMVQSGDLLTLSEQVIGPYYEQKSRWAVERLQQVITLPGFRIHKPEGAIFLWLWFEDLPISTQQLYQRLKARGVLIVPGEYFFFGMPAEDTDWRHRRECIRMNYVQDEVKMLAGIAAIADEVERAYSEGTE